MIALDDCGGAGSGAGKVRDAGKAGDREATYEVMPVMSSRVVSERNVVARAERRWSARPLATLTLSFDALGVEGAKLERAEEVDDH